MKSMKPKKPFTKEDFEKGLMLLGYLLPSSAEDIRDKEALAKFEKEKAASNKKSYFSRVVLAAEIIARLYKEITMGRVKFQKLVYLCECAAEMELIHRYQKQAAGPFDSRFMHSIDRELKKNKWFDSKKVISGNITRTVYFPMENAAGYKEYYKNYFGTKDQNIQYVIELFQTQDSKATELAATVHYCLAELTDDGQPVASQQLLENFYKWSSEKSKFTSTEVLKSAKWLKEKGLTNIEVDISTK